MPDEHGHIAYIEGAGPKPVVLVHPNYAGLKQFDIDQCCFLARCGYAALCVDHYKDEGIYTFADRNPRRSHHANGRAECVALVLADDRRTDGGRHPSTRAVKQQTQWWPASVVSQSCCAAQDGERHRDRDQRGGGRER